MLIKISYQQKIAVAKAFIHLCCLYLLIAQYWLALNDNLGADPVEAILHFTGNGAFNLLLLSLSITPFIRLFNFTSIIHFRRLIGLYSFTYALAHLLSFLAFEVQFNWTLFINEIIDRPYITFGMAAFLILFALAITSPNVVKKQMKKHWQKLHHWIYMAVVLVTIHFYMSVKSDVTEPVIYGAITMALLWFRRKKLLKHIAKLN